MAQDFPRVQFTMPGATPGAPDETVDMISATDDNIRAAVLTCLNGPTTNNGANPSVAVGLMGHVTGHVDFKRNTV